MVSSPEAISFFSQVLKFLRQPVVSPPETLTSIESYILIDSYRFLKKAAYFPLGEPEFTLLELNFLMEAYRHHYDSKETDIQSPQFSEGMKQVDYMDAGGVGRV